MDKYIYLDIHEIFFANFSLVLHEWLSRRERRQTKFHRKEAVEWSAQLIHELNSVSNPISRDVDFWVNNILQGYITEFTVETITSYSETKSNFFQGAQRRYVLSISTWIKMLVYEKVIFS